MVIARNIGEVALHIRFEERVKQIIGQNPHSPFDGKLLLWLKASGNHINEKKTTLCCGEMIYPSTVLIRIRHCYGVMALPIR